MRERTGRHVALALVLALVVSALWLGLCTGLVAIGGGRP